LVEEYERKYRTTPNARAVWSMAQFVTLDSRQAIAAILALAAQGQQRAAAHGSDADADLGSRRLAQQDADYLAGVAATLAWVLGERLEAPITRSRPLELTTRDLKSERVHAEDVIEQARNPGMIGQLPPPWYGEGVKLTITWLLGDSMAAPVDPAGRGPYGNIANCWP
jgi:hypothetical protein